MGEFFKGWRRKAGAVTLLVACVFMVGWVRSHTIDEGVSFPTGKFTDIFLGSGPSGFIVATGKYNDSSFPSMNLGWFSKAATDDDEAEEQADPQWSGLGFQFRTSGNGNFVNIVVPYWSIVIPLSLISSCLFLNKPHKSTPKKLAEPTNAAGAKS